LVERKEQDKAILTVYCGAEAAIINYMRYTELNELKNFIPHFDFYKSLALRTCENVEQLWKQIHDLSLKVISASCVLIIWSYFPLSVISMSLLLRYRAIKIWDATPSGL
jgi:hypothetical protein